MKEKTILVVGGAGYIGSHTTRELKKSGYNPIVFDSLEKGHKKAVEGFELIKGDIADTKTLDQTFKKYKPQAVLHFANYIEVAESVENPEKFFKNNVEAGENLLRTMLQNNCNKIVFSSSAAVYGQPKKIPILENEKLKPINPYGECKLKFEKLLQLYSKKQNLEFFSLRYFNAAGASPDGTIGEDHNPETHLIPLILQVPLNKREKIKIFGDNYDTPDGSCVRDYIHVNDLALAHVLALQAFDKGLRNCFYNLGNGNGFSVKKVIKTTQEIVKTEIPTEIVDRRAGDPAILIASSDKIRKELAWKPRYPHLETIIAHAWKWHKANSDGF